MQSLTLDVIGFQGGTTLYRLDSENEFNKGQESDFYLFHRLNLELRDNEGRVPLWLALSRDDVIDPMDDDCLAANLVRHGASPDAINNVTGNLIHSIVH